MSFAVLPKAKLTLQAPISEFWEDKFPKMSTLAQRYRLVICLRSLFVHLSIHHGYK